MHLVLQREIAMTDAIFSGGIEGGSQILFHLLSHLKKINNNRNYFLFHFITQVAPTIPILHYSPPFLFVVLGFPFLFSR